MALRQMVPTRTLAKCAALAPSVRCAAVRPFRTSKLVVNAERLRLGNLAPEPGSRRKELRKGRGYAAGQGGTCGFGNRGQKARSGPGVRPGFEGGQMPLYRRLPKLRGIAGGMGAGQPDFVVVNLDDLEKHFEANEEVTLEKIREKVQNISGRDAKLPLKVLGDGTLSKPLNVKAAKFSEVAKTKITEAGGKTEEVAGRKKWTKKNFKKVVAQMAADGLDYKKEQLKKKVAALKAKGLVNKKRAINAAKPAKNTKAVGKGKK